jgi:hypothetical protein
MQMRYDIAEAGEIDFVRMHQFAHGGFGSGNDVEQMTALRHCKLRHFLHMVTPDDAAEAGEGHAFTTLDTDDATHVTLPEDFATRGFAQFA